MPLPSFCPNPRCTYHTAPLAGGRWYVRFGSYHSRAHGTVRRFRCRGCGHTVSEQTESLHYFAKRRLPLYAVWESLVGGSPLREIARRYRVSPMAVQSGILRLGRQAMAAQLALLETLSPRSRIVFDGLRSCVTAQDYPCDITTAVDPRGETILSMVHSISCRGGTLRPVQRERLKRKLAAWRPEKGSVKRAISLLVNEIGSYLYPPIPYAALIDTDEDPLYRRVIEVDRAMRHWALVGLVSHIRTPSTEPRTVDNRLFPVNYVDRLLRHRIKEHTRETIACGRHATMQMHRAWIFAWDHNARRPRRVKRPAGGCHAARAGIGEECLQRLAREFFTRRIRLRPGQWVPSSMMQVWLAALPTPPLRWRCGQRGTTVRVPAYARRDLAAAFQQAA